MPSADEFVPSRNLSEALERLRKLVDTMEDAADVAEERAGRSRRPHLSLIEGGKATSDA